MKLMTMFNILFFQLTFFYSNIHAKTLIERFSHSLSLLLLLRVIRYMSFDDNNYEGLNRE